jgi:hypothetical protein
MRAGLTRSGFLANATRKDRGGGVGTSALAFRNRVLQSPRHWFHWFKESFAKPIGFAIHQFLKCGNLLSLELMRMAVEYPDSTNKFPDLWLEREVFPDGCVFPGIGKSFFKSIGFARKSMLAAMPDARTPRSAVIMTTPVANTADPMRDGASNLPWNVDANA